MYRIDIISRRELLITGAAAALVAGVISRVAPVGAEQNQQTVETWETDLQRLLGTAKPVEGKISLELNEVSDNGNTVPFSISAESPMTATEYVKALHVLAVGNPQPLVASFRLTPASAVASVTSRMRLVKSQEIVGVAEHSNGTYVMARRAVKVTIACCGY